ncbi:MAG: branched-chain amino acid ABC transporter permease [Candidatus Vogelbacteria bacterium]|nr:branched-chain amino acid ABC transporter permease [Candidatus Vogelbacteria bacterium]
MDYLIHLGIFIGIYSILGLSLNLLVGFASLISVTHAAFYGLGAYTAALLMVEGGVNFFLALPAAMLLAMLASVLIGLVLSRFRSDYYVLASFGFNVIIFSLFLNLQSVTRGPLGIPGIPRPDFFSSNFSFLFLTLAFCLLTYLMARWLTTSSFGRVLKAIRDDEGAIAVFGYRTVHYKLLIFIIAAGLAALAGALYGSYITFIDPSTFNLPESIFILAIIILGGLANLRGSLLGAACLVLLPELLRFVGFPSDIAAQMRQVVYGLLLVVLMLYRPQGLVGEYKL